VQSDSQLAPRETTSSRQTFVAPNATLSKTKLFLKREQVQVQNSQSNPSEGTVIATVVASNISVSAGAAVAELKQSISPPRSKSGMGTRSRGSRQLPMDSSLDPSDLPNLGAMAERVNQKGVSLLTFFYPLLTCRSPTFLLPLACPTKHPLAFAKSSALPPLPTFPRNRQV
jgi:hypothetical protein